MKWGVANLLANHGRLGSQPWRNEKTELGVICLPITAVRVHSHGEMKKGGAAGNLPANHSSQVSQPQRNKEVATNNLLANHSRLSSLPRTVGYCLLSQQAVFKLLIICLPTTAEGSKEQK
jgi:hypothetical protein